MKYYTDTGNIVEYSSHALKYWGTSAEIYSITKTLYLKEYYKETKRTARMNYQTFKILKNLNHPFTNRILELLYLQEQIKNRQVFLEHPNEYETDAYIYKYLPSRNINFLKQKKEYVYYNLRALEDLIVYQFPELKLVANDLKKENTVFCGDKIVLIDLDNCKYKEKESIEWIRKQNEEKLANLFKNLVMRSSTYSHIYDEKVKQLFALETSESLEVQVERKLRRTKNIEGYLKNKD